jgi:hypothetical protein
MRVRILRCMGELQRKKGKKESYGQYGGLMLWLVIDVKLDEDNTNRTRDLGVSRKSLLAPRSNQLTAKDVR